MLSFQLAALPTANVPKTITAGYMDDNVYILLTDNDEVYEVEHDILRQHLQVPADGNLEASFLDALPIEATMTIQARRVLAFLQ